MSEFRAQVGRIFRLSSAQQVSWWLAAPRWVRNCQGRDYPRHMLIQTELNGNSVAWKIPEQQKSKSKVPLIQLGVYKWRAWTLKPANKPTGYQPRGLQTTLCLKQDILSSHATSSIVSFERLKSPILMSYCYFGRCSKRTRPALEQTCLVDNTVLYRRPESDVVILQHKNILPDFPLH